MFFLGVLQILLQQLVPIIPWSDCFYVKGFNKLTPEFALKNSCCKLLGKLENPVKDCDFGFCKIFINSRFSGHCHGFAFTMPYCLQK